MALNVLFCADLPLNKCLVAVVNNCVWLANTNTQTAMYLFSYVFSGIL